MLIVTGLSGAGKSVTLNTLEDLGYYCVDNLPTVILEPFIRDFALNHPKPVAVAIDSRNAQSIAELPRLIRELKKNMPLEVLFLTATTEALSKRYNESRRPHPTLLNSNNQQSLPKTIKAEREAMLPLMNDADIILDTSLYSAPQLKERLQFILTCEKSKLVITLQSFGFKHGLPINADFVFDVRFLPNPHWEPNLKPYSGCDQPIIDFLSQYDAPQAFIDDTAEFLKKWLPKFIDLSNRSYITVAIGCTGGQHRSVYVTEQLASILSTHFPGLAVEHRDRVPYQPE